MTTLRRIRILPIGFIVPIKCRGGPRQGQEGAPDAWLEVSRLSKGCKASLWDKKS